MIKIAAGCFLALVLVHPAVAVATSGSLVGWSKPTSEPLVATGQEDPESKARVRKLIRDLKAEKAPARQEAATRLGELGSAAAAAVEPLRAALADRDMAVRGHAAAALLLIDQGEVGKAMPVLRAVFKESKDGILPFQLWLSLGRKLRPATADVVTALLKLAGDDHPLFWGLADMTLANVERGAKQVVAVLEAGLKDEKLKPRLQAARCLARILPVKAKQAVPVLREGLTQKDVELRLWAAEELLRLDPDEKDNVVKALLPSLKEKDPAVQTRVALALVEVDEDAARQALPVLREALKDAGTRYTLLGTLGDVLRKQEKRFKVVRPVFEDALKHADAGLRIEALAQLGSLGPIAEPLEKLIRDAMKEKDAKIAGTAAEALMRITPRKAAQLFPTLIDLLDVRDREAKGVKDLLLLIEKLKQIGTEEDWAGSLVEQVEKETRQARQGWHRTELMQLNAVVQLAALGQKAEKGVKALSAVVADRSGARKEIVRGQAALALGRIGYEARTAIPLLLKVSKDEAEPLDIRRAARDALRDIDRAKDK